jgi:hypothetical protein
MILGVPPRPGLRIMLASKPVDFRKGLDSGAEKRWSDYAANGMTP